MERKNVNRGFKKLRVWNNAIDLYILTCQRGYFNFCHCKEHLPFLSLRRAFPLFVIAKFLFLLSLRGAFPFFVIARSAATKQSHPIIPTKIDY